MSKLVFSLQIIAAICAYLIMSIPITSASQISVYLPNGDVEEFAFDPALVVERTVEVYHDSSDHKWENVQVKVGIVGTTPTYSVKKIFLFKCKDSNPGTCSNNIPIVALNMLSSEREGSFIWDDVSRNRVAGFMSFIELERDGRTIWLSYWDEVKRNGVENFEINSYELSSVDVYAKAGTEAGWIKNFMEDYRMIPMELVSKVEFGGIGSERLDKIYKLESDSNQLNIPDFDKHTEFSNSVISTEKAFMFVFGHGSVASAFTLFSDTLSECGDNNCESELGENNQNCCVDCACETGDDCTVTSEYPNGFCHECGDASIDPTENSSTCCADFGCPSGTSCNLNYNPPYGVCMLPACGNGNCDNPEEDVSNCCIDCGSDSACVSEFGSGYYCNDDLVECVTPICGERGCEAGETEETCCLDCDTCPSGEYCNTGSVSDGICMPPNCDNGQCEPGEDHTNCCLDCDTCPVDPVSGMDQTCTANICHFCGNHVYEEPAENENNCCMDSGCASNSTFCSDAGSCMDEDNMGLSIVVAPSTVDCATDDEVTLRVSIENMPEYFSYFYSARYIYDGASKVMVCQPSGDFYDCKIPLTGTDAFLGCFDKGIKKVNVSLDIRYYKDYYTKNSGEVLSRYVTGSADINIGNSKARVCNNNGFCEPESGELPDSCCYDCRCTGGLVCTSGGCNPESYVGLVVDDLTIPSVNEIDCARNTGSLDFSMDVINMPYSGYDPFYIADYSFSYDGRNFSSDTLPGFFCTPETGSQGILTGRVTCSIPVSRFPPCPYNPPATIEMKLNVLGGGLKDYYGASSGIWISDEFSADYIKGLPHCGDGVEDDGETSDNCCSDIGCPDGTLCSLYNGCTTSSELDVFVDVTPSKISCSDETGDDDITFTVEMDPKPLIFTMFTNNVLDGIVIDYYCGLSPENPYKMECVIPLTELPHCWSTGAKNLEFNTTLVFQDVNKTLYAHFSKNVTFEVTEERERGCNNNFDCESELGELPNQCCSDCGCTGGNVCSLENSCISKSQISLSVDPIGTIDCSGNGGFVTLTATIENQPFNVIGSSWHLEMGDEVYGSNVFGCSPTVKDNVYECEIAAYHMPLCQTQDEKIVDIVANLSYRDAVGYYYDLVLKDTLSAETEGWMESCGNGNCDDELGEKQSNCCMDCGCNEFSDSHVCTFSGCKSKNLITMTLKPNTIKSECVLIPAAVKVNEGDITDYACPFKKTFEFEAELNIMPVHAETPTELYYTQDGGKRNQEGLVVKDGTIKGWSFALLPKPVESRTKNIDTENDLDLSFSLIAYDPTGQVVIPLESENNIRMEFTVEQSDHLIDVEKKLDDHIEMLERMNLLSCIIKGLSAVCLACTIGNLLKAAASGLAAKKAVDTSVKEGMETFKKTLTERGLDQAGKKTLEKGLEQMGNEVTKKMLEEGGKQVTDEALKAAVDEAIATSIDEMADKIIEDGVKKFTDSFIEEITESAIDSAIEEGMKHVAAEGTKGAWWAASPDAGSFLGAKPISGAGKAIGSLGAASTFFIEVPEEDCSGYQVGGGIIGAVLVIVDLLTGHAVCAAISWPCFIITVLGPIAILLVTSSIESDIAEVEEDIANDVALAQSELYSDISFYYG